MIKMHQVLYLDMGECQVWQCHIFFFFNMFLKAESSIFQEVK